MALSALVGIWIIYKRLTEPLDGWIMRAPPDQKIFTSDGGGITVAQMRDILIEQQQMGVDDALGLLVASGIIVLAVVVLWKSTSRYRRAKRQVVLEDE